MSTKTARMQPGDTFVVRAGEFRGRTATIVDPKPFPDTDVTRRRKITVSVDGEQVYLLPRLLETNTAAPVVPQPSNVTALPIAPIQGGTVVTTPEGTPIIIPGNITDSDDPRLDPWRPGKGDRKAEDAILRDYISRTMANGAKDVDFLLDFYEQRENVLLVGDTQSGKTMMVSVLAILAGRKHLPSGKAFAVFTLSGSSGVTDFDLFGQPTTFVDEATGRERLVMLPGVVDLAVRSQSWLYLDEINMMSERTTSSLHPVCDDRRSFVNRMKAVRVVEDNVEVFMPETVEGSGMWIIGTINPAGYKGTSMNEAFLNRFTHIPWGYDDTVEKRLVPSAAVRLMGQALREARATRAINTPIGTSALSRMCSHVDRFGPQMAVWMLVGMFLPQEQPKVQAIITDRSIEMMLDDEQQAKASSAWVPPTTV